MFNHFQHQDKSITKINFLRYSDEKWKRIAGNQFAYYNRLSISDYLALFKEAGFDVIRQEAYEDEEARKSLADGFSIDDMFCGYSVDDLYVTQLRVALKVRGNREGRYLS